MADVSLLLTDLYELNMLQAYQEAAMSETAVFEFFVRKLPENLPLARRGRLWPDELHVREAGVKNADLED